MGSWIGITEGFRKEIRATLSGRSSRKRGANQKVYRVFEAYLEVLRIRLAEIELYNGSPDSFAEQLGVTFSTPKRWTDLIEPEIKFALRKRRDASVTGKERVLKELFPDEDRVKRVMTQRRSAIQRQMHDEYARIQHGLHNMPPHKTSADFPVELHTLRLLEKAQDVLDAWEGNRGLPLDWIKLLPKEEWHAPDAEDTATRAVTYVVPNIAIPLDQMPKVKPLGRPKGVKDSTPRIRRPLTTDEIEERRRRKGAFERYQDKARDYDVGRASPMDTPAPHFTDTIRAAVQQADHVVEEQADAEDAALEARIAERIAKREAYRERCRERARAEKS
jgi:hypothetical protein